MQLIKHAPDLYEIPQFLTENELALLENILSTNTEHD